MKYLLPLFVAIAVCTAGVIKDPTSGYKEGDRFFYFPGDDEKLYLVDIQEPVNEELIRSYTNEDNSYLLFTRENPDEPQYLRYGDIKGVTISNFDSDKETVFFAHGWNGDGYGSGGKMITEAFLEDKDVNVIVLDWGKLANQNYVTAKRGVPVAGKYLGQFINFLTTLGLKYEKTHLVGFSLGGHLVGSAGRETGSKVQRITSLDPAGPLWIYDSNRIKASDAQYVEVIHTNTDLLGLTIPCGDADFYPNGGASMPGCLTNNCSHSRAVRYMASSVKYNHLDANRCSTILSATSATGIFCRGNKYPMGNSDLSKSRSGIFRVNTGRSYPY